MMSFISLGEKDKLDESMESYMLDDDSPFEQTQGMKKDSPNPMLAGKLDEEEAAGDTETLVVNKDSEAVFYDEIEVTNE